MDYLNLPSPERIQRTIEAVTARGINVTFVEGREDALAEIYELIPTAASVMTGSSVTLQQIGLEAALKMGDHTWWNMKADIIAEKDPIQQAQLRKQATLAEYYLGSVHAIAETGEILIASATGSQLAPYAFSSAHVIWVAGAQKIVPTLEDAFRRLREYVQPLEDRRLKQVFGPEARGVVGKILVFERESPMLKRSVNLILVNEVLGF
jgi:L-lactate utilization protein LutB